MISLLPRAYEDLNKYIRPGRVLVIHGPRRVGKTTLVKSYLSGKQNLKILEVVGDDIRIQNLLASPDLRLLKEWVANYDVLFIDEAQRIPEIGWGIKLLIDFTPNLQIILTGSASFELAGKLGEPLTGRQVPLTMYPIAIQELRKLLSDYEIKSNLEQYLIYGMYPEVITSKSNADREFVLRELVGSYLFKDILALDKVKNTKILSDLLVLLALQIGSEVSHNELASKLKVDVKTITRYLDLFEKSFILYNLRGFSRNLRKEITRTSKYYFYDTGIRNAVLENFNPLSLRDDVGALWENFIVVERLKKRAYEGIGARDYFWRTWDQNEIDLLEEHSGTLKTFEIKWSPNKQSRAPLAFIKAYPDSEFTLVNSDNFLDIL